MTNHEHRAFLLAASYGALGLMRRRGHGHPSLATPLAAAMQFEADERGERVDLEPDGALAVACVSTIEEVLALARISLNETQRACVAAEALNSVFGFGEGAP